MYTAVRVNSTGLHVLESVMLKLQRLMNKPAAISRDTIATLPRAAAQWSGVLPEKSVHSMLVSGYNDKRKNHKYTTHV